MKLALSLTSLAALGILGLGACAPERPKPPKPPEPEHYVCSDFEALTSDLVPLKQPQLQDQFGKTTVEVSRIRYLCAPASKEHEGKETKPKDFKGPHLACYDFITVKPDPNINRAVSLTNQFEKQGLKARVAKRKLLCVPSSKLALVDGKDPKFDPDEEIRKVEAALNHFTCADLMVRDADLQHGRLNIPLTDQFGPFEGPILKPDFLCAPTAKTFNKQEKKPAGGLNATHLACYRFVEERGVALPANVLVVNQLDRAGQRGRPTKRFMFCVPTKKELA